MARICPAVAKVNITQDAFSKDEPVELTRLPFKHEVAARDAMVSKKSSVSGGGTDASADGLVPHEQPTMNMSMLKHLLR